MWQTARRIGVLRRTPFSPPDSQVCSRGFCAKWMAMIPGA